MRSEGIELNEGMVVWTCAAQIDSEFGERKEPHRVKLANNRGTHVPKLHERCIAGL